MNDARFSMRLPRETLAFAQGYAAQYDMTLTDLVTRYLERLRAGLTDAKPKKKRKVRDIAKYRGILKGIKPMTDEELEAERFKYLSEKYT